MVLTPQLYALSWLYGVRGVNCRGDRCSLFRCSGHQSVVRVVARFLLVPTVFFHPSRGGSARAAVPYFSYSLPVLLRPDPEVSALVRVVPRAVRFIQVGIVPVTNSVLHIVASGPILQVRDTVIGGVGVLVPDFHSCRARSDEHCCDSTMYRTDFSVGFTAAGQMPATRMYGGGKYLPSVPTHHPRSRYIHMWYRSRTRDALEDTQVS